MNFKLLMLGLMLVVHTLLHGQAELNITVYGNCGMCKERIEDAAKDVIGVNIAEWDMHTQNLYIKYQEGIFTEKNLHQALAAVGHDTDKIKVTQEVYDNLHHCCQYERTPLHEDDNIFHINMPEHEHHHEGHNHEHHTNEAGGMVYEKTAKGKLQPIIGANVFWVGTQIGTVTDIDGHFELPKTEKTNLLAISYIGYAPDTIDMKGHSLISVTMRQNFVLDEVNITYKKKSTEVSFIDPIKMINVSQKELCKAACCSLSESFETNPAIDVSFTDAVTGTRKIEMLGLAGPYVQIMRENIPYIRGLSAITGLAYTPGPWVESMQLNLGSGSVVNGPESMTGQINIELKKPETSEQLFVNLFANKAGRLEANVNTYATINDHLSTGILFHGSTRKKNIDRNNNGFHDTPLKDDIFILNRWKYTNENGLIVQLGAKYANSNTQAGQLTTSNNIWKANSKNDKLELWTKIGKTWDKYTLKSIGWQTSYSSHSTHNVFGNRIYTGDQSSLYSNFIFANALNNDASHRYKIGASFMLDYIDERLSEQYFKRKETMPGIFAEYSYLPTEKWSMVLGIRGDYHNNYGVFVMPRVHIRYNPQDDLSIRIAAGRGQRTASVIAENIGLLASNRVFNIVPTHSPNPYGLNADVSWSMGANITKQFTLLGMPTVASLDYYYTWFEQQAVVDIEETKRVSIYNLDGSSNSHSVQLQADTEISKGLDIRLAYRYNDVMTTYTERRQLQKPFTAKHRAFANVAWEIRKGWSWDGTINWQGSKRIPSTSNNPAPYQLERNSPAFTTVNTQLTKTIQQFDIYIGAENLLNYTQKNPILAADAPMSPYFDAALIWGPVLGRNVYMGLRWKI